MSGNGERDGLKVPSIEVEIEIEVGAGDLDKLRRSITVLASVRAMLAHLAGTMAGDAMGLLIEALDDLIRFAQQLEAWVASLERESGPPGGL